MTFLFKQRRQVSSPPAPSSRTFLVPAAAALRCLPNGDFFPPDFIILVLDFILNI